MSLMSLMFLVFLVLVICIFGSSTWSVGRCRHAWCYLHCCFCVWAVVLSVRVLRDSLGQTACHVCGVSVGR